MITKAERERLRTLNWAIIKNTASFSDYKEYERILLSNGYNETQIKELLQKGDFENFRDFQAKRENRELALKSDWEIVVAGGLVALGLALIIYGTAKK